MHLKPLTITWNFIPNILSICDSFQIHNRSTEAFRRMYQCETRPGSTYLTPFLWEIRVGGMKSKRANVRWGDLRSLSQMKVNSAPQHQTQILSTALLRRRLALSLCLLWSALKEGHILLLCTPELLSVFLCGWGTKGKSVSVCFCFFKKRYFCVLICICCGLRYTCFSMKKTVGELC